MDWMDAAQRFGLPTGLLVCILGTLYIGIGQILRWAAKEMVVPIRDRLINWFDMQQRWMERQQAQLDMMSEDQVSHHVQEQDHQAYIESLVENLLDRRKGPLEKPVPLQRRKPRAE